MEKREVALKALKGCRGCQKNCRWNAKVSSRESVQDGMNQNRYGCNSGVQKEKED